MLNACGRQPTQVVLHISAYIVYSCMCQTELNAWPRSGVMEANLLSAELLSPPMLSQDKSAKKKKKFAEVLLFLLCEKLSVAQRTSSSLP